MRSDTRFDLLTFVLKNSIGFSFIIQKRTQSEEANQFTNQNLLFNSTMSERAISPAPNLDEVEVERAHDADTPVVEPAYMSDSPPKVEPCAPVDDLIIDSAAATNKPLITHPKKETVESLRGGTGAAFETYAAVLRGNAKPGPLKLVFQCCTAERDFVSYSEVSKNFRQYLCSSIITTSLLMLAKSLFMMYRSADSS